MKRTLSILAALLVLAGVIAFTVRRAGGVGAPFPASRAAELAPADAVAFLQIPNFDRVERHRKGSAFGDSDRERDFALPASVDFFDSEQFLGSLYFSAIVGAQRADAENLFLAATELPSRGAAKLVGGLCYRGRKGELDQFLRRRKEELFNAWPAAKSVLSTHGGIEIESIEPILITLESLYSAFPTAGRRRGYDSPRDDGPEIRALHFAFRDNWLFIASDVDLLTATLDRYLGKPDAPKSFLSDPAFTSCRGHEVAGAELTVWLRCNAPGNAVLTSKPSWPVESVRSGGGAPIALQFSGAGDLSKARHLIYLHCADLPQPPAPKGVR